MGFFFGMICISLNKNINLTVLTYIFIVLSILLSGFFSYFHYYFETKNKSEFTKYLFLLRFLSFFLLLLLFINPKIERTKFSNEKPVLSILKDNSSSISYLNAQEDVNRFVSVLKNNKALNSKFTIQEYKFGKQLNTSEIKPFNETSTDISKSIKQLNTLQNNIVAPVILITDGNQTQGIDYEYINTKSIIFPVVIGDTSIYSDVRISKINVNKFSFLNNKFPVEIFLNYTGVSAVNLPITIQKKGKTVFKKIISLSKEKKSFILNAKLNAQEIGPQFYDVSIGAIPNEKNKINNKKSFSLNVINEQQKIALITSTIHPDLGALKKIIESDQKRRLKIFNATESSLDLNDYQLVILYQPTGQFSSIFEKINEANLNFLLVSGEKTDWNFINQKQIGIHKNVISQTELYSPIFNNNFIPFKVEDLNFNVFTPLKDKFGNITFKENNNILLFQGINNVATTQPLLAVSSSNKQKKGFLFGEGIWKWRAASFLQTNSFKDFDYYMGSLLQYLVSRKKQERLSISIENSYAINSDITVSAFFTDENYLFDDRANLEIKLSHLETKEVLVAPFSLANNSYEIVLENLNVGTYSYEVSVVNQNIKKNGKFKITEFKVEEQFTSANANKLEKLAINTRGELFYKNQVELLIKSLVENDSFYTIQKATKIKKELINWKWIMFLVLILLSLEWFVRKYNGKI